MTAQEIARVVWNIKDIIRDVYDDTEVEDVILPFTLLRRLDCILEGKHELIEQEVGVVPAAIPESMRENYRAKRLEGVLHKRNLTFYNSSKLTLKALLASPDQIGDNFKAYLEGFTSNIKDILANFVKEDSDTSTFDLSRIYSRLERSNLLFKVCEAFVNQADLSPDKVDNAMMGTIFEIVIRWSKESTNSKAGQFYTPREIVRLLVKLTLCGKDHELHTPGQMFDLYDPCCGTGGMLTVAKDYLTERAGNPNLKVRLFGQEISQKTYAICKADLLIKGDLQEGNLRLGDTLADDLLPTSKFTYMLANPPFGTDWKKVEASVKKENCLGGRFEAGLPGTSDGSLLFLLHMISKMREPKYGGSRIGIVLNGSPLFNGDAGSGWSNIRKMLLDRNLLDAIVRLPKNMFYGTDINTYLWILDNNRPDGHRGKVLFVDADHEEFYTPLQRSLGKKRFEISESGSASILDIYSNYASCSMELKDSSGKPCQTEVAKLIDSDDFLYTKVTVERPLRLTFSDITGKFAALRGRYSDEEWAKMCKRQAFHATLEKVAALNGIDTPRNDADFFRFLKDNALKLKAVEIKELRNRFAEADPDAPEILANPYKADSGFVADTSLRDTELIPLRQDIDEYFEREVLRFVPDAWMDRSKDKAGCEFPFSKLFYVYKPLRDSSAILDELFALDSELENELKQLKAEQ